MACARSVSPPLFNPNGATVNRIVAILLLLCAIATAIALYFISGFDWDLMRQWLQQAGWRAPFAYVSIYAIATFFILPSTALNLMGGALFGPWWGTVWTSLGAIAAALAAFLFGRTVGRDLVQKRLAERLKALDAEFARGGMFYIFAIRLLPIVPYGLVNFCCRADGHSLSPLCNRHRSRHGLGGISIRLVGQLWLASRSNWQCSAFSVGLHSDWHARAGSCNLSSPPDVQTTNAPTTKLRPLKRLRQRSRSRQPQTP